MKSRDLNRSSLTVIVGSEIRTEWGDVVCLFLEKEITSKRFLKVVEEVREQNGLLILAHPFWKHTLSEELLTHVDLIEVFNSRISPRRNLEGETLAKKRQMAKVAVSDAHLPWEIGKGMTCFDLSTPPRDLREMILKEERSLIKVQSCPVDVVISQGIKVLRKKGVFQFKGSKQTFNFS